MKKLLPIIILVSCSHLVYCQSLKIDGYCPIISDGVEVSLSKITPRRLPPSTELKTTLKKHKFTFNTSAKSGEGFLLTINNRTAWLYFGPGKANIVISDSLLRNIKISGNREASDFESIEKLKSSDQFSISYAKAKVAYYKYLESPNHERDKLEQLSKTVDSLKNLKKLADNKANLSFIESHPKSLLNTLLIYNMIDQLPEDSIKVLYNRLPKQLLTNTWGKELTYRIDSLFVGGYSPAFSQKDTLGNTITSTIFRGKYLLIDFWASWCIPCRAENPNLLSLYRNYHAKGLEILAVSLDKDRHKWLQAIKEDRLPWQQVSDLREFDNAVSKLFYVYAIPDNYLIDPDGRVLAKGLRGRDLQMKLAEVFK